MNDTLTQLGILIETKTLGKRHKRYIQSKKTEAMYQLLNECGGGTSNTNRYGNDPWADQDDLDKALKDLIDAPALPSSPHIFAEPSYQSSDSSNPDIALS
jgi:hypothetical protein